MLLEAASVRAARLHAAPVGVERGASTGSPPRNEESGDGSASRRDLGGRRIRRAEALSAAARAVMVESADLEARGHAGVCVQVGRRALGRSWHLWQRWAPCTFL